ncbi:uncharacterized protein LOC128296919 [Anopheles moucheti]|uniref:uncharacterized protein LOC128296919 n=1 Tax=Anopheles moucheti TaxID=186751 RepID=UPI0022F09A78|nr:uncharacterized protein LOC128296919 [Anopheles moucheti]
MEPEAKRLVFVGYSIQEKAYRLVDTSTDRVVISRDVVFNETSSERSNELPADEIIVDVEPDRYQQGDVDEESESSNEQEEDYNTADEDDSSSQCSSDEQHHLATNLNLKRSTRDLGVWLDDKLSFEPQLNSVIERASKVLGLIFRMASEVQDPLCLKALYCCWSFV